MDKYKILQECYIFAEQHYKIYFCHLYNIDNPNIWVDEQTKKSVFYKEYLEKNNLSEEEFYLNYKTNMEKCFDLSKIFEKGKVWSTTFGEVLVEYLNTQLISDWGDIDLYGEFYCEWKEKKDLIWYSFYYNDIIGKNYLELKDNKNYNDWIYNKKERDWYTFDSEYQFWAEITKTLQDSKEKFLNQNKNEPDRLLKLAREVVKPQGLLATAKKEVVKKIIIEQTILAGCKYISGDVMLMSFDITPQMHFLDNQKDGFDEFKSRLISMLKAVGIYEDDEEYKLIPNNKEDVFKLIENEIINNNFENSKYIVDIYDNTEYKDSDKNYQILINPIYYEYFPKDIIGDIPKMADLLAESVQYGENYSKELEEEGHFDNLKESVFLAKKYYWCMDNEYNIFPFSNLEKALVEFTNEPSQENLKIDVYEEDYDM